MIRIFTALLLLSFISTAQAADPVPPPAKPATPAAAPATPGTPATPATPGAAPAVEPPGPAGLTKAELSKPFKGSFFLSPSEMAAIQLAMMGGTVTTKTANLDKNAAAQLPQRRLIRVSGVIYRGPNDWTAWINGVRITPSQKSILPEIIAIDVKSSTEVYLKWYDVGLKTVLSITLRPQQTYDIVTGILVPGTVKP